MVIICGELQHACLAGRNLIRKHHSRLDQSRSTFLYGITEPLVANRINENRLNINIFRLRRDGSLVNIPLRYNPAAFATGYAGTVNFLTASPDGHFLFAECENTAMATMILAFSSTASKPMVNSNPSTASHFSQARRI